MNFHPCIFVIRQAIKTDYFLLDVRTQGDYQRMSPDFIGLIFSCFNEENLVSTHQQ